MMSCCFGEFPSIREGDGADECVGPMIIGRIFDGCRPRARGTGPAERVSRVRVLLEVLADTF
jgi:hypothetical protein